MKIYEHIDKDFGRAFKRISHAFKLHFPNVEWVNSNQDIEIVHTLGKTEYDYLASKDSLSNVVIIQHCFFTTHGVSAENWIDLWKQSKLTVSFHDLQSYTDSKFNFIRVPWGAEPDTFPISKAQRFYMIFSTGHVAETECLDKVYEACKITNNKMLHTGENFGWDLKYYQFFNYMEDPWYCNLLQRVKYIPGLRDIEGFEMACIEGAMTGAVPIVPNIPTYDFYKDFCIYIDMKKDIVEQLVNIFKSEYKPLSTEQINYIRKEFAWKNICNKIYSGIVNA